MNFTVSNGVIFCEHGTAANPVCDECRIFNVRKSEATPTPLESLIEAECTKLLEQDGWRALRTDPVSDRKRGAGFGELSMADHQYTRPALSDTARKEGWCQLLYVEFKRGKQRATKAQIAWHERERARGFVTWIANEDFPATVEGFREHYAKSGLMRRPKWW